LDHTLKVKEILKNEKFDGFIFFITLYNSTNRSITKDFKLASHVMKHLSPYAINCDTKTFIVLKKWDLLMHCCEDQPEDLAEIEEEIEKIPIEYEKLLTGIEKWLKVEKGIFYKAIKRIPTIYKLGKKLDKFDGENLIKMMKTLIEKKNQIPKRSFSRFTIDHAIHNLSFDEGDLGSMENFNAEDFSSATRIETNKIIEENHLRYDSLKEDNQMFRNQIMIMNEKLDNQAKIQMRLENEIKFELEERIKKLIIANNIQDKN